MEKQRQTLASKFGMFSAFHGSSGGMGNSLVPAFMAVVWGAGSFYFYFFLGLLTVVFVLFIVDSVFGAYTRRAPPQAWHVITKGNKFFTFWIWFGVMSMFVWMGTATALYGTWLTYLVAAPFRFWGSDPSTFFWVTYLTSYWPLVGALVMCFIWWLVSYKSVNVWARIALWAKPAAIVMAVILIIVSLVYTPEASWQGWGMTFDLKASKFMSGMVFAQAMLWVYWRSGVGSGVSTAFASYLPKGGDINTACLMERFSDVILLTLFALFIVPLTMGFGFPPLFSGSLGLAFSALPKVWNALGASGIGLSMLFYALFIPTALPMNLAYFETNVATYADKFGMPRTKTVTIMAIAAALLSILFTIPVYDSLNGNSYGFTLLFTAWYWEILILGLAALFEFIVLFKYFKIDKLIAYANETSVIKISPKLFKGLCYLSFLMVLGSLAYLFLTTAGIIPGVSPGAAGSIIGDGTGYYGFTPIGYAMIFVGLGIPLILALIWTATDK